MLNNKKKKSNPFLKFKRDDYLQFFAFVFIFLYPFNYAILSQILFKEHNSLVFTGIGVLLLLLSSKTGFTRKRIKQLAIILLICVLLFWNNQYILNDFSVSTFVLYLLYITCFALLLFTKISYKALNCVLCIYSIEHIIGTIIPIVAPDFYEKNILAFMCEGKNFCFAISQYLSGKNVGLTTHYSSNGINMAISSIWFSSTYMKTKSKKYLLLTIISVLLLFVIGKRAHLLFSIIAIIFGYLFGNIQKYNSIIKLIKKNIRIVIIAICSVALLGALMPIVPQLNTTIERFRNSKDSSDIMNGREELYELAIEEWKNAPIIGNGYGYYYYKSNEAFSFDKYKLSNIHAHNDFLELLCDIGVIGMLAYVIILLLGMKKSYSKNKNSIDSTGITLFCFQYVIFYILYCFSGTPLYIELTFLMLLVSLGICNDPKKQEIGLYEKNQ